MGRRHDDRALGAVMARSPRPVRALSGVVLAAMGGWLLLRPVAALAVLVFAVAAVLLVVGIIRFLRAGRPGPARTRHLVVALLAWFVGGAVAAWPAESVRAAAGVAGGAVIVSGGALLAWVVRRRVRRRVSASAAGVAALLLGSVALRWPDVTVVGLAVLFSLALLVGGLIAVGTVVWRRSIPALAGWANRLVPVAAAVALALAVLSTGVSVVLHRGEPRIPDFYATPAEVSDEAGRLLRYEPYEDVPAGAEGWRILYTTTRADGGPAVASGVVVVPRDRAEALPVVAWAHGTTGVDRTCAPSLLDEGLEAGAFFLGPDVVERGWALVATDYVGLGAEGSHAYLVGDEAGRAVLDSVRAARELEEVVLAEDTVVWGHSQGGAAALWTGQIAPEYAPDVEVAGVAALAPAADVVGLVDELDSVPGGGLFASYVVAGYSAAYDDVVWDDVVVPTGRLVAEEVAGRCLAEPQILLSALTTALTGTTPFRSVDEGPLARRLAENVPVGPFPAPVLVAQGADDTLVLPDAQARFVDRLCAAGEEVERRGYEGLGHLDLVEAASPLVPELIEWTEERFAGEPASAGCDGPAAGH